MEIINKKKNDVLILGAGPNGLAAAASLTAAGAEVQIHGSPMDTWKVKVPEGMILRSSKDSSSIASPGNKSSIAAYEKETGASFNHQATLNQFLAYTSWFQKKNVPNIDETRVKMIDADGDGFTSVLEDGRVLKTGSVVLSPGITLFPYSPPEFTAIPNHLASHTIEHHTFTPFIGKSVVVIGQGQSALETAALLHERGALVEIITRGDQLKFIPHRRKRKYIGNILSKPKVQEFLYPPTDLAGPPQNWAIADPTIYRRLSKAEKAILFELVGPIGSTDLEGRLAQVKVTTNTSIKRAFEKDNRLQLELSDGTSREVDHVFIGTGFRPDINRLPFLSDKLKAAIEQEDCYPKLTLGYESISVKGLYVTGALAGLSQGPITRFVCGTVPLIQYLTEAVTGSRIGYPSDWELTLTSRRRWAYKFFKGFNLHL